MAGIGEVEEDAEKKKKIEENGGWGFGEGKRSKRLESVRIE